MSSPERNKDTSGVKETVSLPAILTVQHDQKDDPTLDNSGISDKVLVKNSEMGDDANKLKELKKVTLENQKIIKETIKLARKNQTSLEINSQLHLANLQAQNQKLVEEVLLETNKTNTLLATQSEIYAKILEANKSQEAIPSSKSVDTNCVNTLESKGEKLKEKKRSLEHEEISDKKVKK
ncbi:unnamed protein product [Cochlearia groenlandica]